MKRIMQLIALLLALAMLTGCAGTAVVYYGDCTCPTEAGTAQQGAETVQPSLQTAPSENALMTGLYISANISGSASATADKNGEVKYDVTIAAVTLDANGVIQECIVDSLGTSVAFDAAGLISSDLGSVLTKRQLGLDYGMKNAGSQYEWYEQADALGSYAVGKTLEELKSGAINESGMAADVDLATTASIYLGGYVQAIEGAVRNAQYLGATQGDQLKLAVIAQNGSSTDASAEGDGLAQLDSDVVALTMNGDVITSCVIDSLQAKANFAADGSLVTDPSAPMLTKNQLGEDYGMKKYGAQFEWNEQAASFCQYVTGKTLAEVEGIAIAPDTKPTQEDLAATVTISIGGFQALIRKAAE